MSAIDDELDAIWRGPICAYCGLNADGIWNYDHIVPRSWSCDKPADNTIKCCAKCNRDKGTHDPVSWFVCIVRCGGRVGHNDTLADKRASCLWAGWSDEIIAHAEYVRSLCEVILG